MRGTQSHIHFYLTGLQPAGFLDAESHPAVQASLFVARHAVLFTLYLLFETQQSEPKVKIYLPQGVNCDTEGVKGATEGVKCATEGVDCAPEGVKCATEGVDCATESMHCATEGVNCATEGEFFCGFCLHRRFQGPSP
jgi:hypothetical protein